MENQKTWIGGARLDILNATWPFAKLTVTLSRLELKVKFWGSISFTPDQITEIEPVGIIPYLGNAIQIHHTLDANKYPSKSSFGILPKIRMNLLKNCGHGVTAQFNMRMDLSRFALRSSAAPLAKFRV